jgi:hypothetical protein
VRADQALKRAHLEALKKLHEKDPKGEMADERKEAIQGLEKGATARAK